MALIKKQKTSGKQTEVTFKISNKQAPSDADIFLVGDFNHWQMGDPAFQMEKTKGGYSKKVVLNNGKKYEFRYVNRNFVWFNDDAADAYVPSPFHAIDNCVVDLSKVVAKRKRPTKKSVKDDLTKIEGIGPKIAGLLAKDGISTFESLGKAKVRDLSRILKEAGPRYTMHKPNSWPKQAKLAAAGKWDALKKLQDQLDGGK